MKVLAGAVVLLATAGMAMAAGYDSLGFESFMLGPLDGQDGWVGSAAGGGIAPQVVTAPDPVLGERAVRLEVGDTQGDSSQMDHAFIPADLVAAGYTNLVVSYDIYRQLNAQDKTQNIWWWLWDAGSPTYGLQWDQGPSTCPHGWNEGAGSAPTVLGRYANVTMEWDLVDMKAYSWYDGVIVDNGIPIADITALTGWTIQFGHDSDTGTGGDVAWIDNFQAIATPEPASLALLALGGLALLRRR